MDHRTAETAAAAAAAAGASRAELPNPVEDKEWQGVPVPPKGSKERPKLADSVFVGKSCRTRDKTVRTPEDVAKDNVEDYYWLHPNLKTAVKPKGPAGVQAEVKHGPYTIKFAADKPSGPAGRTTTWSGEADVKLDLTGAVFPEGAKRPPTDYKAPFRVDVSHDQQGKQVQTLTFQSSRQEGYPAFFDGNIVEDTTVEHWFKASSDGEYVSFSLYKDKAGKILAYMVDALCGTRFNGNGELTVSDETRKITPATERELKGLMGQATLAEILPGLIDDALKGSRPAPLLPAPPVLPVLPPGAGAASPPTGGPTIPPSGFGSAERNRIAAYQPDRILPLLRKYDGVGDYAWMNQARRRISELAAQKAPPDKVYEAIQEMKRVFPAGTRRALELVEQELTK